jgi:multidrug resistance efflux pump
MTTDERIAALEAQIDKLKARQSDLYRQLAQAQRDQWQGRIDDLEVQMHLGAMEANDRVNSLMDQLRTKWAEARGQFDEATSTASSVADTLRSGLEKAVRDVRNALLESKNKIAS